MHAWFLDPLSCGDRRLPHRSYPPKMLELGEIQRLTNIKYFKVDMDDIMAMTKRISILKHDHKIVHMDLLRVDHEQLKSQENLLDDMYKPTYKNAPTIHMITGGEVYYDVLVERNNNEPEVQTLESSVHNQLEHVEQDKDEEDHMWIRIFAVRGDLIIIPKDKVFRSTTTGTDFVRVKRFHQSRP